MRHLKTNIKRNKIMKLMKTLLFGATMLVMAACGGNKDGEAAKQDAPNPEADGAKAAELVNALNNAQTQEEYDKAMKKVNAFREESRKLYAEDKEAQKKFEEAYSKKLAELQGNKLSNGGSENQMMEGEDIEMPEEMQQAMDEANAQMGATMDEANAAMEEAKAQMNAAMEM